MGTYCVALDIEYATGWGDSGGEDVTISSTIVEAIIANAEGTIEGWLDELNATGSASSAILKTAAIELSVAYLITRLRMANKLGNTVTLGGDTISQNWDAVVSEKKKNARAQVESYARSSLGDPWAASDADAEATIVRQDHEMGQYQLDQSTVREYHDRADEYGTQDREVT